MGMPAAKQGDQVIAQDMHMIVNSSGSAILTPHPFNGMIDGNLSTNVNVMGLPAATVGSTANNTPPHLPIGGTFQKPPANQGIVQVGSSTVRINGKSAARNGDTALTCNDPTDLPVGTVVASGTVMVG